MPIKKEKHTPYYRFLSLITEDQHSFIAKKANGEKKTKGQVVREMLEAYIIKNKK